MFGIENDLKLPPFFSALEEGFAAFGHTVRCGLRERLELVVAPRGSFGVSPFCRSLLQLVGGGIGFRDVAEYKLAAIADAFAFAMLRPVDTDGQSSEAL